MKKVTLFESKKKRIDKFSLTPPLLLLISTLLYFMPAAIGGFEMVWSNGRRGYSTYSSTTNYVALLIIALILSYILFNRPKRLLFSTARYVEYEAGAILVVFIPLMIYTLSTPALFSIYKTEVLEATDRLHSLFYNTCIVGVIFSSLTGIRRNYTIFIACSLGLLLAMYIGHRSYLAIAILAITYVNFRNKSVLKIRAIHIFTVIICFFTLIIYKPIYAAVKDGNVSLILYRINPENIIASAIIGSEQFLTYSILDHVVDNNFKPKCSNIWITPLTIIPFTDSVIGESKCSFNGQVQSAYFSGYSGGVAANIWAEFYSNFGILGLPILLGVLFSLCALIERLMSRVSSPTINAGFIVMIIQMVFYIQRNEFLTAFTFGKRAVFGALLIYIISRIIRQIMPVKREVIFRLGAT